MKRSTQIALSATGLLLLASTASLMRSDEEKVVYEDTGACLAGGELTKAQCEQRFEEARSAQIQDARKFGSTTECEAEYGQGRCEVRTWNGTDVVVPALAGFVLARSLMRGGGVAEPLLPPTREACPPGDPRDECRPRSGFSTTGGTTGGGSRSSGSRAPR